MSLALFDLADFEETKPVEPTRTYLMFECGIHREHTDWEAHLSDCWEGHCPSCGEQISAWFDMHTNHGTHRRPAWPDGLCSKQNILMNHARAAAMFLDGEWGHGWTNCHTKAHRGQHRADGYFAKGAPVGCVVAYYVEKRDWLLSHRVPLDQIASPKTDAGLTLLAVAS